MRRTSFFLLSLALLPFLAACGGGSSTTVPITITVLVTPSSASVVTTQTKTFSATVSGTSNQNVTWSVVGGASNGTISATGLYTAPAAVPNPAVITVMATSQANSSSSGSAAVTVTAPVQNVTVVVSPSPADVATFGTQQFSAMVTGSANTAVTWQVNGTAGGTQQTGFISSSGLYFAPSGVPTASNGQGTTATTVTVTAVSQANTSDSGSSVVTLTPAGQNSQAAPISLGASGSNAKDSSTSGQTITCCGGTLGSLVARGGTQFLLSNTHVLARSDLGVAGDAITNPGLIDNNCAAATTVANLTSFYNLETGAAPHIDAAIAQVVSGQVNTNGKILYLGATVDANGVPVPDAPHAGSGVAAVLNHPVAKSGRSTGLTCSTILAVAVNVNNVQYQKGCGTGTMFTANYTNQVDIAGGSFSAEGDSGSLIVTQDTADPVALLFAGSDTDTVGNPVSEVLNFFQSGANSVTFVGDSSTHAVIGCTLPAQPASAMQTLSASAIAATALQKATSARDAHVSELMAHPEVQAIGIGASYDNPKEAAILFFITKGQPRTDLPLQVDGVRTRIIEGNLFSARGSLSAAESAALEQSAAPPQLVYSVSDSELARAKIGHTAHASDLIKLSGVQGVGITSSVDSPGEAALMIYTIRGATQDPIPPVIDGLRTRIRESSRFRAGYGDSLPHRGCSLPTLNPAKTASAAPPPRAH